MADVLVTVEGGVVQHVQRPPWLSVEVLDFDRDAEEEELSYTIGPDALRPIKGCVGAARAVPRLLWLAEDLAAFGSKPDGFEFDSFGILVERARDALRVAKGRPVEFEPEG